MKKYAVVRVRGQLFILFKSKNKNKKYDVYTPYNVFGLYRSKNSLQPLKFITSFGDSRYQHFYDKIGMYDHLNHNDLVRRKKYRSRHTEDHTDPTRAGYWSWNWLW